MIDQAIELHRSGDIDAAERAYREVLKDEPDHFEALHFLGLIRQDAGALDEALDLVEKAIELKPEVATYHATLGSIRYAQGDIPAARVNYEQAMTLDPNLRQGHNTLGFLQLQMGEAELAEKTFNTALRIEPNSPQVYANLGQTMLALGRVDDAVSHAQQALSLDPSSLPARATLADALMGQGAFAIAEQAYRTCLDERAGVPTWVAGLANSLVAQGRAGEARSTLHAALAEQPDHPHLRAAAGRAALALEHWHDAAEHFKQSLLLRPGHPAAIEGLGDALRGKGELAQARQCFDAASSLTSQVKSLQVQAQLGDTAAVLADLKSLLANNPDNAEVALALVQMQETMADEPGALDTAMAWLALAPESHPLRNTLALIGADLSLKLAQPEQLTQAIERYFSPSRASDFDAARARALAARALDLQGDYPAAAEAFQSVTRELTVMPLALPSAEIPPAIEAEIDDGREAPVILTGLPGSGVELLAEILNAGNDFDVLSDRISQPGERRDFLDSSAAGRRGKRSIEDHHRLERRAYWNAAERQRRHTQGRVLALDYVPLTQLRPAALAGFLPSATVVLAVRHPGDLLLHARTLGWQEGLISAETIVNAYRSIIDCAQLIVYPLDVGALFDPDGNGIEHLASQLEPLTNAYDISLMGVELPPSQRFLSHHMPAGHHLHYAQNLALLSPALSQLAADLGY